MAIVDGDIDFYHSATGDLGGAIGAELTDATVHNLFDIVSSAEESAGDTEYRCMYVKNSHGTLSLTSPVVWIQTQTPSGGTSIEIGLGSSAVNGTEQTIADESTAPTGGVAFTSPASEGAGLSIATIPAGEHKAIWVKRIVVADTAGAVSGDSGIIRVKGDTAA